MRTPLSAMPALTITTLLLVSGCQPPPQLPLDRQEATRGKVLLLLGAVNTRHHLSGLAQMIREAHPGLEVVLRPWGVPLLSVHNLRAYERNREVAGKMAGELADYRRAHPDAIIDVLGYSGGGGVAVFLVEALPPNVQIDRLILVAPAISRAYPLKQQVFPHVREFIVNYASDRDVQVGWGTATFGTIDRVFEVSAGYTGFELEHPRLVQVRWDKAMKRQGHHGNHRSYRAPPWQRKYLLPALDPGVTAEELRHLTQAGPERTTTGRTNPPRAPHLE
jgi:pimeloyl-ACP methyl ester carboxylesterase